MTRVYYKEAVGCILVFDVTRPASFEAVQKWKLDLDTKVQAPNGGKIPCVLLGNKVWLPFKHYLHCLTSSTQDGLLSQVNATPIS